MACVLHDVHFAGDGTITLFLIQLIYASGIHWLLPARALSHAGVLPLATALSRYQFQLRDLR